MALVYRHLPRGVDPVVETVTVDRYWYLTEDKSRVVEEGHPDGRSLWASPGTDVPRAEAERLGAVEVAGLKEAPKPADKQFAKPGDKHAKGDESIEDLRQRAAELGVQVDNRWGAPRLQREIDSAEAED